MTVDAEAVRLAVLLPVYNGEKYLAEAVRSVLAQTFEDFELLVIDDGSTDGSADVLKAISDPRLRIIQFPEHRGLVPALNEGIRASRSELIARMDADDVCLPNRFERQIAFLDSHPGIVLCGTWTRQFGDDTCVRRPPTDPDRIRARLFFSWSMDHPSIMFRRDFIERHRLVYDDQFRHVEDYDFFLRAAALGDLANLPEILLRTRSHSEETSVVHEREQVQTEAVLMLRELRKLLPDVTKQEEELHLRMINEPIESSELPAVERWLRRLDQANRESERFEPEAFRSELCSISLRAHAGAVGPGFDILNSYRRSSSAVRHASSAREYAVLASAITVRNLRAAATKCKNGLRRSGMLR